MMDVCLTENNILRDDCGNYVYLDGLAELTQRVRIACTVPRGAFVYDRTIGIDLRDLQPERETLRDRLELRVREACVHITGVQIRVTSVQRAGSSLSAVIAVSDGSQTMTTEVSYSGLV